MAAPIPYVGMSYGSLTQQIIDYANRDNLDTNFVGSVPYFIFQAQQRIWRESKDIGYEVLTVEGTFQQNQSIIEKNANWNKTISFIVGSTTSVFSNSTILELHTYEYCMMNWPNTNQGDPTGNNPPLYYADHQFAKQGTDNPNYTDNNTLVNTPYSAWFVSPTPYLPLKYQIIYEASPSNIYANAQGQGNLTNVLTLKFPDVLFYASMCEAFSYTQESERVQIFENLYARSLESMNAQTTERYTDRTSKRNKD